MTEQLGKLRRVELRDVWKAEDKNFTPWLASKKNLELLAETVGMELELDAQEKDVGPFRADILCRNLKDDSWVLIENQLERTDHTHLGQLLTYAAGLDAVNIVWIAAEFTEQHRASLDWLNTITSEKFRFFGLEVELWRIGESLPAPKFNIVAKPNNWAKTVKQVVRGEMSAIQQLQYRYWDLLNNFLQDSPFKLNIPSARPQNWHDFRIESGIDISAAIEKNKTRVGLYLQHSNRSRNKTLFHRLSEYKEQIEQEIGEKLEWEEMPQNKRSRIALFNPENIDINQESDWERQHRWFKETIEAFDRVFRQRVKDLDPDDYIEDEDDM